MEYEQKLMNHLKLKDIEEKSCTEEQVIEGIQYMADMLKKINFDDIQADSLEEKNNILRNYLDDLVLKKYGFTIIVVLTEQFQKNKKVLNAWQSFEYELALIFAQKSDFPY